MKWLYWICICVPLVSLSGTLFNHVIVIPFDCSDNKQLTQHKSQPVFSCISAGTVHIYDWLIVVDDYTTFRLVEFAGENEATLAGIQGTAQLHACMEWIIQSYRQYMRMSCCLS